MTRRSPMRTLFARIRTRSGYVMFSDEVDSAQHAGPPQRLVWAAELVRPMAGARIVDVGCWTGALLALVEPLGPAELVGIDLPGPWLCVAQRAVPSATFLGVSSLTGLPASFRHHFDGVFFLETLEHLPRGSQVSALRALASLLAPGGKLVLSTPAAGISAPLDPAWLLVGHRHYRLKTVAAMLASAGLEVSCHHYSGNAWTSLDAMLLYSYKYVLHRSYSPSSMMAARTQTGLYARRRLGSANIWVEARLPRGDP